MIEEIKELYNLILDKNALAEELAKRFFVKVSTVKNHWCSGSWSIPSKYQKDVLNIISKHINKQIEYMLSSLSHVLKNQDYEIRRGKVVGIKH